MLSLPDMREKQILFVETEWGEKTSLRFWNDNLVFTKNGKTVNRVSCHKALVVFVMGDTVVTTPLLREAKKHGMTLVFLKQNFEQYASFGTEAEGHWVLREKQYTLSEESSFAIAKHIVSQKIEHQIINMTEAKILQDDPRPQKTALRKSVFSAETPQILLGIEGSRSKEYFGKYFASISWRRRAPRTKEDIPNLLLDIGYTLLFNFTDTLLRLHGFDTYKGVYHTLFFGRRSLACDVMEPMRCLVDKRLRKAYHLGQIDVSDFSFKNGQFFLPFANSKKYTKFFSESIMTKKEELYGFIHGFYQHILNPKKYPFPILRI
jgi:CRISP-associated protein Cas1